MMQELNYIRCGDYYIPDIRLPKETRPIGRWGRMHRDYIKEHNPIRFNDLCLSGEVWTYLADLNEQAQSRLELIIEQMKASEGVTEGMKQHNQMTWVRAMNSIRNRAEEIVLREMICKNEKARQKYRDEHDGDFIILNAAKCYFDSKGLKKLPSHKALQSDVEQLIKEKNELYNQYQTAKEEAQRLDTIRHNIEQTLGRKIEHKQEQER